MSMADRSDRDFRVTKIETRDRPVTVKRDRRTIHNPTPKRYNSCVLGAEPYPIN